MLKLNKAQIVAELEAMVSTRLFGRGAWLTNRETSCAVNQKLIDLGLVERVSDDPDAEIYTPLGKELDIQLFEVFMGMYDFWEVPFILEDRHLIDETETDDICERMSTKVDPESVLLGYVRRAYFDYRNATNLLH